MTDLDSSDKTGWVSNSAEYALDLLAEAQSDNRPVVLLLGAGMSADAGIPLAGQLSEYLVHVDALVREKGFSSARQYIEETRWPSRHDLRVSLMLELGKSSLLKEIKVAERLVSQSALVSELRRGSPTFAFSLHEIFGQLKSARRYNQSELAQRYSQLRPLAQTLAKRIPRSVAYRSLLFHLCDNDQTLIDACLDHFIRDRTPTTTHQLIVYLCRLLRSRVILSTNFDPLVERAFDQEGIPPTVYEIQGAGTIPSPQLLLSQHLSVVKLHGGTHQLRTGFDLDDPLPPTVLASFYEMFDRLEDRSGQQPLLVVMGYGGSDRRVMDIVNTQVKRWKGEKSPCVLWVNREPWQPPLLVSAVSTHPKVLFNQEVSGAAAKAFDRYRQHPVHVTSYREGRLFLLEAYQRLAQSFPVARSNYQSVNFVPHSTRRENNEKAAEGLKKGDWRFALLAAENGGGSSSQLAAVAENHDPDYRVIWIDMAEVSSVSALLDVLSERLTKVDFRLHPLHRPLLLDGMLVGNESTASGNEQTQKADASITSAENRELRLGVRWLQHALRRGRYLLALDSVDEFPGAHPALADLVSVAWRSKQQSLLVELLKKTLVKSGRIEDADGDSPIADSRFAIASKLFPRSGAKLGDGPLLPLDDLQDFVAGPSHPRSPFRFVELPGTSTLGGLLDKSRPQKSLIELWEQIIRVDVAAGMIIAVAACARRIRSECLLIESTHALLQSMRRNPAIAEVPGLKDFRQWVTKSKFEAKDVLVPISSSGATSDQEHAILVGLIRKISGVEPKDEPPRGLPKNYKCDCPDELLSHIRLTANGKTSGGRKKETGEGEAPSPRWFYRLEGGYHWMHAAIRDELYESILKRYPRLIIAAHFYISRFCYDHLYDRAKDARAFLEYMFHRTAGIRQACNASPKVLQVHHKEPLDWLRRLVMAVHREKATLMTRARLPSLVFQFRQLNCVLREFLSYLEHETLQSRAARHKPVAGNTGRKTYDDDSPASDVRRITAELLGVEADALLAGGHPHSAVSCLISRIATLMGKDIALENQANPLADPKTYRTKGADWTPLPDCLIGQALERVRKCDPGRTKESHAQTTLLLMRALSDLASAVQTPFLCLDLPAGIVTRTGGKGARDETAWVDELDKGLLTPGNAGRLRERRFALCRTIYDVLSSKCHGAFEYYPSHRLPACGGLPVEPDGVDFDFPGGVRRRQLELELLEKSDGLVANAPLYRMPIKGVEQSQKPPLNPPPVQKTLDLSWHKRFEAEIPRLTRRRRRHECYRRCLVGRRLAYDDLDANWTLIRRMFVDAESVLNREGDPADRQALGITRLTHAEHCLRRAERARWHEQSLALRNHAPGRLAERPPVGSARDKAAIIWRTSLEQAEQLLALVDPLLNEGRGENAWRFYHLLTMARLHMFRAYRDVSTAPVKAHDELLWAGRYLASGLTNCGEWNDRRWALSTWWDTLIDFVSRIEPKKSAEKNVKRLKAQLGIKWDVHWRSDAVRQDGSQP